jgi:anti-sigma-K factor RskA
LLYIDRLTAIASDQDYQIWVTDRTHPTPIDSGVLTVDPESGRAQVSFRPKQAVNNVSQVSISVERKGGAPQPEGPILLVGDL